MWGRGGTARPPNPAWLFREGSEGGLSDPCLNTGLRAQTGRQVVVQTQRAGGRGLWEKHQEALLMEHV